MFTDRITGRATRTRDRVQAGKGQTGRTRSSNDGPPPAVPLFRESPLPTPTSVRVAVFADGCAARARRTRHVVQVGGRLAGRVRTRDHRPARAGPALDQGLVPWTRRLHTDRKTAAPDRASDRDESRFADINGRGFGTHGNQQWQRYRDTDG